MKNELDSLSAKELRAFITAAGQRLHLLRKRKPIASVRKKLQAAAQSAGYTIAELFPGPRAGKPDTSNPMYRNPANAAQTWSGRGREPRWFKEALLQHGYTRQQLRTGRQRS